MSQLSPLINQKELNKLIQRWSRKKQREALKDLARHFTAEGSPYSHSEVKRIISLEIRRYQ